MFKTIRYDGRAAAGLLAACMTLLAPAMGAAAAPQAQAAAPQAQGAASATALQLRWELQRNVFDAQGRGRTQARFILANRDSRPLPPRGWSLYFNAMDSLQTGTLASRLVLEQVAGQLWRLRPGPGFAGLAPGATLDIAYQHNQVLVKMAHAPVGPYLVYDAAPDVGTAIADYAQLPMTRPEQLDRGAGTEHALVSPADTYRRNQKADVLPAGQVPPVLPTPLQLRAGTGRLALAGQPVVTAPATLANEAALARSLFPAGLPAAGGPALRLDVGKVPGQASPEAYRLVIGAGSGIAITGNSAAGVAYGLQTLRDLMPLPDAAAPALLQLPELTIVDAPRFGYRGFMLDVSRNFHGKEVVFKWLDLMARLKLNKFHFHLTEDEGWRLEIAGLPELTAVGAVRGHSGKPGTYLQPAYGSGPDPRDASGTGHFTRADYIGILRYAAARHIDVIPEIEMPGHARAAVQAMEARYHRLKAAGDPNAAQYVLNDFDDKSVYSSPQYYNDHVINPGLESSYTFVEHVVKEVVALHREAGVPLRTIHMGGDELPEGAWEKSPVARAMMAREKLATTADLWDYFYGRVDGILKKHGLYTSGWEELAARRMTVDGRPKLMPNPRLADRGFVAYVWNNVAGAEDLAYRLANAGYDIVLAPVTKMYLDMAANANPGEAGVNWGAYVELDDVYDFIPLDYLKNAPASTREGKERLSDAGRRRVRGMQATLFTETFRDPAMIDHMVLPRLAAVAERAWAPDPAWATESDEGRAQALHRAAWSGFVNALGQRVLPRLDLERKGFSYRIAPPGLLVENGRVLANHVLPGLALRYTSDGSAPTAASQPVTGPIAERGTIKVAAFDRNGRAGMVASVENR